MTDRGPGRPDIGPQVKVSLPDDLIRWLDGTARQRGTTRAALVRQLLQDARTVGIPAPRRPQ